MDSASSVTTVWVTLISLANAAVVITIFFSIVLLIFGYYTWRHQLEDIGYPITCTCISGVVFLLIFLIILVLASFDLRIAVECHLTPGMFCEDFSWTFFSLTIMLLLVYVIWLIFRSRGTWRYWWYGRIQPPLTASSEVSNDFGSLSSSTCSDRAKLVASNLDSFMEENKDCNSEDFDSGEVSSIISDAIPAWVDKMANNWFNFGIALGFSEEYLQLIRDSNDDDVARCSVMMYHWLRTGNRSEKTHERLLRAAKEATPTVATSGRCTEPPTYSEHQAVNEPHYQLQT